MSNEETPEPYVLSNVEQAGLEAMKEILARTIGTDLELTDGITVINPRTGERCAISKSEGKFVVAAVVR